MKKMKYESLDEVVKAYQKGELDGNNRLMLDNDVCFIYKDGIKVFEEDPDELLEEALFFLGIPCAQV